MATSLGQEGNAHNNNNNNNTNTTRSFIITLSRTPLTSQRKKIRIRIPKAIAQAMHRGGARSQPHGNGKGGGSIMVPFFCSNKLQCQLQSSTKTHSTISQGLASKARLFRKLTWGKLTKKPVFRPPNLFRTDPVMKLLKSRVEKKEGTDIVVPNRGIQRIRRILQSKQVSARKSICQTEAERDHCDNDREDGELELCKKRILLGSKCRPLGRSGTLRYDQNGILLPELFP